MNVSTPPRTVRHQLGLSLVELMVALVLGLFLVAGVLMLFVGSKQAYRFNDSLARQQESARFAMEAIARDLRMAGFLGCASRGLQVNNILNGAPPSFAPGLGLTGWEATSIWGEDAEIPYGAAPTGTASGWTTSGGAILDSLNAMAGSDIVRIWYGDEPATINSITSGANTVVNITPGAGFQDGNIILLSDCSRSDWVQACNVQDLGPSGNPTSTNLVLSAGCTPGNVMPHTITTQIGGQAMRMVSRLYYVGKRGDSANNPPALFRRELADSGGLGPAQELVEGVENLQILYGIDANNDGRVDQFVTANNVGNWNRVISARVSILLVSLEDNLMQEPTSIVFDGLTLTPNDRRARQVMTATVTVRNRLP